MTEPATPEALKGEPPYSWQGFARAAQNFARSAATNYTVEEAPFFYLHAGAAVELLLKAVLCRSSPVLLLEGQRFSELSLLRLAGYQPVVAASRGSTQRRGSPGLPYTVGFAKAVERVGLLHGPNVLGVTSEQVDELKAARDLVAHGADDTSVVSEQMHRVLVTFGTCATALLPLIGLSQDDFWGESGALIERALDSERDAITARVRALYAAARARYETQFRGIEPSALETLKEEAYWTAWSRGEGSRSCPVCDARGLSKERAELRRHLSRAGRVVVEPGFAAIDFRCPVCKLVLETESLVEAAPGFEGWQEELDDVGYWVDEFGAENLDAETRKLLGVDWYDEVLPDGDQD